MNPQTAILQALVTLLGLLLVCTGCRTASQPGKVPTLGDSLSSNTSDLPPEVRQAWVVYIRAKPGEQRHRAAAKLLHTLNEWVGTSADSSVRARVELLSAAAAAQAHLDQATNSCDRARAAEGVILLLKRGMDLAGWQPEEAAQLRARFEEMHRSRDQALFQMRAEESAACVKNRESYPRAIEALEDLAALCRRFAAADYWSVTERDEWSRAARELDNRRSQYVGEFDEVRTALRRALEQAQKVFINNAAAADCRTAREIRDAQDDKKLNWSILVHFRDDPREFAKAAVLLDRVIEEERVDCLIRLGAATLRSECGDRLGRRGRDICARLGKLPGYDALAGFPNATDEELRSGAEQEWRKKARPAPSLREAEEIPQCDLSLQIPEKTLD